MNTFLWTVLVVFMCLFLATGFLTLLGIVRFGPRRRALVTIEESYLNRLFTSLLLEVVAIGLSVVTIAVNQLRGTVDGIKRTTDELNEFRTSLNESLRMTSSWLNEPSGLTTTSLAGSGEAHKPFGLAVDDEKPDLFVVEKVLDNLRVRKVIELSDQKPKDLEAITWDREKFYYATTSFRQLGEEGEPYRKLLRFKVDSKRWVDSDYEIATETRDFSAKLGAFLVANHIPVDWERWSQPQAPPQKDWHPWQLEIEGLAVCNDELVIGLKWPLTPQKEAILLTYNWAQDEFREFHPLDLNGKGISDLAYDPEHNLLFVAANPPEKEREKVREDESRYLGESSIQVFDWADSARQPKFRSKLQGFNRPRAKLEGIAIIGDDLWLAYDGPNNALVSERFSVGEIQGRR